MSERRYVSKDHMGRMAFGVIALQLIDDCYKGKSKKGLKSNFLTKGSLLRDKVGSKC